MSKQKGSKQDAEFKKHIDELTETVTSALALLRTFLEPLQNAEISNYPVSKDSPDPVDVLHTAGTLLKAHTTKLSLLIINKPFTPAAVRKVISEVANTCVPAMMSAVKLCRPAIYGHFIQTEVKAKIGKVFRELKYVFEELLDSLSSGDGKIIKIGNTGRDALSSTGVLWQACDELIGLKNDGLAGLLCRRVELYQLLLEDATSELLDWADDEPEEDENDGDEIKEANDNFVEDLRMDAKIPKDRPNLKSTLDVSLRKLKQIKSMYAALLKHRLRNIDMEPEPLASNSRDASPSMQRVDQVIGHLSQIPEQVDELAGAFYDLEDGEARTMTQTICTKGKEVVEIMKLSWTGQEDKFTEWAVLWLRLIDQI